MKLILLFLFTFLLSCSVTDEPLKVGCDDIKLQEIVFTKTSGNCWDINYYNLQVDKNMIYIYNDYCEVKSNQNNCIIDYEIKCPFNFDIKRYFSITQVGTIDLKSKSGTFDLEYYNADNKCNSTYNIEIK